MNPDLVQQSLDQVTAVIAENEPCAGAYALFSGGNDSLTATSVIAQHPMFRGVIHLNTGIGIEETRQFVRDTCAREGWPLREIHPPARTYEDHVLSQGFPGPGHHSLMYRYLKERGVRVAVKQIKAEAGLGRFSRVILTTGARLSESKRRMHNVVGVQRAGAQVWVPVIKDWTKRDTAEYIEAKGYPRNLASDLLHMSGECLCGAFAKEGELDDIALWFPDTAAYIRDLEDRARAAGRERCVWGARPAKAHKANTTLGPLCSSCEVDVAL